MAQNSCFARMTGEQVSMVITSEQEREAAKLVDRPVLGKHTAAVLRREGSKEVIGDEKDGRI
jgi:hypothetical protein